MSHTKKKGKDSQTKKNANIANEIKVKVESDKINLFNDENDSILFNTYILSNLQNKVLKINDEIKILFLEKEILIKIIDAKYNQPNEDNKNENTNNNNSDDNIKEFTINSFTDIIIEKSLSNQIDNLIKDFNNLYITNKDNQDKQAESREQIQELSPEEREILKSFIDKKIIKNKSNGLIYNLINEDKNYQIITELLKYQLLENNEQSKSALLAKDKESLYYHKGIIINGISGLGKTNFINYLKQNFISNNNINCFELNIYKELQNPEINVNYMKSIFLFSKLLSPSIIIIDDIDYLFPNNSNNSSETEILSNNSNTELTPLLCEFINQILELPKNVIIIGTAKNQSNINPKLTKLGFLDFSINFSIPNFSQRTNFINFICKDFSNNLSEDDIANISNKSHGFVYGDFIKLFKEANLQIELSKEENKIITKEILDKCINTIKPINLKDIILDIPKVKWEEIGGNTQIIKQIRQSIEWPIKNPEAFIKLGIKPPNGILLYGPPGCSKTMIAKALATESGLNFFAVKGPELFSKFVGDTEKAVRNIFKKARLNAPSIIFFDEIDSIASARAEDSNGVEDKVLCQLLNEMDGIESREKVIIFGATNRPDILDKAIIRPGRFDRLIYIPPPDDESREQIFKVCLKNIKVEQDIDYHFLALQCENFSGADISKVCTEAGMLALENDINCEIITKNFILEAIKRVKPVITKEMIKYFENFGKKSD